MNLHACSWIHTLTAYGHKVIIIDYLAFNAKMQNLCFINNAVLKFYRQKVYSKKITQSIIL